MPYGPVVKLHWVAVNGLPAISVMPPVSRTVNWVFAGSVAFGLIVSTRVAALYDTTAAIRVPVVAVPVRSDTVAPVTPFTFSLNVAVMLFARLAPTAPLAGVLEVVMTVGAGPVRNVQVVVGNGFPAVSRIATLLPVNVTVYSVSLARLAFGLIVNTLVVALKVTNAATGAAVPARTVAVVALIPETASL